MSFTIKTMRKIVLIVLCCFMTLACAKSDDDFRDTSGHLVKLNKQSGKWIILNYWAPWCASCVHEIPELNRFYRNNLNKNVLIYGINYDNPTLDELKKSVKKFAIAFPTLTHDPKNILKLDDVDAIPTTFIISPNGKVVKKIVGATTEKSLLKVIASLSH